MGILGREERSWEADVVVTYSLEMGEEMSRMQVTTQEEVTLYLRKARIFKDGKEHIYWSLVESVRTANGPRQLTVACLGELNESQQKKWKVVANQVGGKPIIRGLFDSGESKESKRCRLGKYGWSR